MEQLHIIFKHHVFIRSAEFRDTKDHRTESKDDFIRKQKTIHAKLFKKLSILNHLVEGI